MSDKPVNPFPNDGRPWTVEEIQALMAEARKFRTARSIAPLLGRTATVVITRASRAGIKFGGR